MASITRTRTDTPHLRFPNALGEARVKHGDSQEDLATALELKSRVYIALWEAGTSLPSIENLERLKNRYGEASPNFYPVWVVDVIVMVSTEEERDGEPGTR